MSEDPFRPLGGSGRAASARGRKAAPRIPVMPVPKGTPRPPAAHPELGKPSATWAYRDANGGILGYALRFDTPDGKQFRPLTCWQPATGGALEWRWEAWQPKRPLYGLQELAERPSAPTLVCEGEKAADAASGLLPGFVAVTSPNGSQSAHKADWTPLRRRQVTIWPDADLPGARYADEAAKQIERAGAESVTIISPPGGFVVIAKQPETDEKRETDWTVLRGRRVVVWSDADAAYADEIAKEIEAAGAESVTIEPRLASGIEGWDAADARAQGWTEIGALALVSAARPAEQFGRASASAVGDDAVAPGGRRRNPQKHALIALTEFCELWHDTNGIAYVTYPSKGHREHWRIQSQQFRTWLQGRHFIENGEVTGGQPFEDVLRILEARAIHEGTQYETFIRIGRHAGKLYLDLCDAQWRAVKIDAAGYRTVEKPPVKLLRSRAMRELPEPEGGYQIEELRRFVNVITDEDWILVVAFLIAAFRDRGPYPILVVNGEQGAGKSVFSRMIRLLVDPSAAPIRAVPREIRDLVVSANNSWMICFDNLSSVTKWSNKTEGFGDAICQLATGIGFATRQLHTDLEEMIFEGQRPIILNGIANLTGAADLASRSITVHLSTISDEARRPEDEFWAEFEAVRPRVLGAALDAVSAALRNIGSVRLEGAPRMADFVKWVVAAAPALGFEPGEFEAAYRENRRDVSESSFESDPFAVALVDFAETKHPVSGFTGTATELHKALELHVPETIWKSRLWPNTIQGIGSRVRRVAPLLRNKGFAVDYRHSGERLITIAPPRALPGV